jgi:two-component system, sensor histidine kinase and response regulator
LHFRVTDSGIGIPVDKQEAIFAPFTQADGSMTRRYGGTGLGLAICSQLVDLMCGRLWVESEVGRGSTFHFIADLEQSKAPRSTVPGTMEECLNGLFVLVVDDSAVNRRLLERTLELWGMKPVLADGAQTALAHLHRAREAGTSFSLVLIDAMMPQIDGFTLAERIKSDPQQEENVLLMLTTLDRPEAARRVPGRDTTIRGGATIASLNKPIDPVELKTAILTVLGQKPQVDSRSSHSDPITPRPNLRALRILMAEDNPFNHRVALLILAKLGSAVTVVVNGREAIEILQRQSFDLVLMDLQMPEMDGLQATVAIQSSEAGTLRHIPIVAMTAHAMNEDRDRCLAAGMDDYVSKPIQEESLRQAIERCL